MKQVNANEKSIFVVKDEKRLKAIAKNTLAGKE
jgi:hypothetical protein